MLPYPSRQQGTCTCSGRPLENHRQSPPALCHRTYISHPSRTRVGRREPPLVGVQKATEPAYPRSCAPELGGHRESAPGRQSRGVKRATHLSVDHHHAPRISSAGRAGRAAGRRSGAPRGRAQRRSALPGGRGRTAPAMGPRGAAASAERGRERRARGGGGDTGRAGAAPGSARPARPRLRVSSGRWVRVCTRSPGCAQGLLHPWGTEGHLSRCALCLLPWAPQFFFGCTPKEVGAAGQQNPWESTVQASPGGERRLGGFWHRAVQAINRRRASGQRTGHLLGEIPPARTAAQLSPAGHL